MNILNGTNGNDDGVDAPALLGTSERDFANGSSGDDIIKGKGKSDKLSGGEGSDEIRGGSGNDEIWGHGEGDETGASGDIVVTSISTGVSRLVFATSAPGEDDHLFLLDQHAADIYRFDPDTGARTTFLNLPTGTVRTANEEGLLGLAFHPDYETNGRFYLHIVNVSGDIEVVEYTRSAADPTVADPASARTIITVPHPLLNNHNGGSVEFGPDGMLYVSVGDGGGGGDPGENAQDTNDLLGSILRIDVDGDDFPGDAARNYAIPSDNPFVGGGGAPEIWDYGLRNPFRIAFDPVSGDLVIADVGQGEREEIDVHQAGDPGGLNFGWDIVEGTLPHEPGRPGEPLPGDPALTDPIFQYTHSVGFSVTGGVFNQAEGGLNGAYFFADFVTNIIWSLRVVDGEAVDVGRLNGQLVGDPAPTGIAAFANGPDGAFYAVSLNGVLSRFDIGEVAGDEGDMLYGGKGADRVFGGRGEDFLYGGSGKDSLFGGDGTDEIRGGSGADQIFGGVKSDILCGHKGDDVMAGDGGADMLNGGRGNDVLTGDGGADIFKFFKNADDDRITDFKVGTDMLDLKAYKVADFATFLAAVSNTSEGALVDLTALGGDGSILIEDLRKADLDAGDLIL